MLDAGISQGNRDFVPLASRLNVGRVRAWNRAAEPILLAVGVDPVPGAGISVGGRDIEGLAVAVTAGHLAAAVQGVAAVGLEARSEALA
jgi:hypothetical protein